MDTCTNCGATLRPGAKFCTTCGTRMNEAPPANTGSWGTARSVPQDNTQETSVLSAVQPPTPAPEAQPANETTRNQSSDSWSSAYSGGSESRDDPASRFISALDNEVQPAEDKTEAPKTDEASGGGSGNPVFTPPPPSNWSYSTGTGESTNTESTNDPPETPSWEVPSTWTSSEQATDEDTSASDDVDAAGFTDDGDNEVDWLSGDENIEVSDEPVPTLPPDEARVKAIALADELRRTIRMMGSGGESDHGAAVMALTDASLHVGDFSDVRDVIAEVQSSPRDIQALNNLAGKVDRLETLLEEHASLVDTIERAITELNG